MQTQKQLTILIKLAFPAVLSQLAQMGMGFIDVFMASHHHKQTLASISIGSNIFFPLIIFFMGLFLSISPLAAEANAKKQNLILAQLLKTCLWIAVVLSVPVIMTLHYFDPIIDLLKLDPAIHQGTNDYLKALSWGVLPLFLFLVLRFFNEGLFQTRPIMLITLSALPINIILNYVFLYHYHLGAAGLGYATSIAYSYLFVAIALYTLNTTTHSHIQHELKRASYQRILIKKIIRLGTPIGIGLTLEISLFAGIGLLMAQFGTEVVAGHQVAMNYASMAFMIPLGISIATTSRVGFYFGLGDFKTAARIGWLGTALSTSLMAISALMMLAIPEKIVGLYTQDSATMEIAIQLLSLAALFQLFDGIQVTLTGALRGLQDTKIPMLIGIVAYWVFGFPLALYFSQKFMAKGLWMGILAALGVAAVLLSFRFYRITQRNLQF